jgi:hypothetical protein
MLPLVNGGISLEYGDMASATAVSFTPTTVDIERYRRLRTVSQHLNQKVIKTLPEDAMLETGRRLGILQGRTFLLDSEDELSVVMDCCLHDLMQDGKNAMEWYLENHSSLASPDERELLEAFRLAQYRIVFPLSRVEGAGLYFKDLFTQEELFVMDIAMSQNSLNLAYATRTIPLGAFWMTGGAGLPAGSDAIRKAGARLHEQGLLHECSFTDPHRAAITIVRTLLQQGAAGHIKYADVLPPQESGHSQRPHPPRQSVPASMPSRNSACPCGSGRRYKRCCGRR